MGSSTHHISPVQSRDQMAQNMVILSLCSSAVPRNILSVIRFQIFENNTASGFSNSTFASNTTSDWLNHVSKPHKIVKFVFNKVENILGKGENAAYLYFLFLPQYFQRGLFPRLLEL